MSKKHSALPDDDAWTPEADAYLLRRLGELGIPIEVSEGVIPEMDPDQMILVVEDIGKRRKHLKVHGFAVGDIVEARVAEGPNAGKHRGAIIETRPEGIFRLRTKKRELDVSWEDCRILQYSDGFLYHEERYGDRGKKGGPS
jgi:hypothetical protein